MPLSLGDGLGCYEILAPTGAPALRGRTALLATFNSWEWNRESHAEVDRKSSRRALSELLYGSARRTVILHHLFPTQERTEARKVNFLAGDSSRILVQLLLVVFASGLVRIRG